MTVQGWQRLHPKLERRGRWADHHGPLPIVVGTIIRVQVPAVRTPQQADRWTWLIIAASTQLRLARGVIADQRLPWERRLPPARLTPTRIRRGFRRIYPALGTPAGPAKPSRAGPGRPKGTLRGRRTRHPAIKKAA